MYSEWIKWADQTSIIMQIAYLVIVFVGFTVRSWIISIFQKESFGIESLISLFNLSLYFWLILLRQSVLSIIIGVGYLIWIIIQQEERDKVLISVNVLLVIYGLTVIFGIL